MYQIIIIPGPKEPTGPIGARIGAKFMPSLIGTRIKSTTIPEVGEIIAWRAWRVDYEFLRSITINYIWLVNYPAQGDPTNPNKGIHAYKSSREALKYGLSESVSSFGMSIVVGSVRLFGIVEEHDIGYRAQYARVNSIINVFGFNKEHAIAIAHKYAPYDKATKAKLTWHEKLINKHMLLFVLLFLSVLVPVLSEVIPIIHRRNIMEIGEPVRRHVVIPLREPVIAPEPKVTPPPRPAPQPEKVPEKTPA